MRGQTVGPFRVVGEVPGVLLALLPLLVMPPAAPESVDPAPTAAPAAPEGPVACRLMCLLKWSLLMNLRSHTGHPNFFSPVCVRL